MNSSNTGAICLLLVNKIPDMPRISISSVLNSTTQPVFLGYVNPADVQEFANNPRILLLDLRKEHQDLNMMLRANSYAGWTDDDFFKIVQLKWVLLQKVLGLGFEFVIYSDLDVLWQSDAYMEVKKCFDSRKEISIQIQSFTRSLSEPKLCMGFVAFRNTSNSREFIANGASRHRRELLINPRIGDDDIATLLYSEMQCPAWIFELPQTTFPVGASLNLFRGKPVFPGLLAQEPFIFHANFVIGLMNKILLMKLFLTKDQRKLLAVEFSLKDRAILNTKRIKRILRSLISR